METSMTFKEKEREYTVLIIYLCFQGSQEYLDVRLFQEIQESLFDPGYRVSPSAHQGLWGEKVLLTRWNSAAIYGMNFKITQHTLIKKSTGVFYL